MTECPVCHGENTEVLGNNPDFAPSRIVSCRDCSLSFTTPMPNAAELEVRYREEYRKVKKETPSPEYVQFMATRATAQRDFIASMRTGPAGSVLDIGCGCGELLAAFDGPGVRLVGFEPDELMSSIARGRLPRAEIATRIFETNDLVGQRFDVITMSHVLEHIIDPARLLEHLLTLLGDDGTLFIEVPNDSFSRVRFQVRSSARGLFHLWYFQPSSLSTLLTEAGGSVVILRTYGPDDGQPLRRKVPDFIRRPIRGVAHALGVRPVNRMGMGYRQTLMTSPSKNGVWLRALVERKQAA